MISATQTRKAMSFPSSSNKYLVGWLLMMLCGPARLYAQEAPPRGLYDAEVIAARKIPALEKLIPVLMDKAAIPGLQVALIYEGNEVWHKAFGVKSLKTKEPLNDETLFDGASLSKPVLAYTGMRLIDRGGFDLDTPLTRYRPYPDVKDDDRVNRITARMVLSHTTGFPNWRPRGGDLSIYFEPGGEHPALEWLPFEQFEESQGADTVRQAIERGYEQYIKAFGEADAAGVATVYAEHGARLYAKGRVVRGRDAIQVDVARFLERVGPVTVTIEIEEFWVMDDTAYETGKWTYTYTPAGQDERTSRGRYLTTWKRQPDGDWKMWADMALPND